ncbi:MAG: transferase [Bacteroidetes bacterium]|nr:transferase [Bacteroidota bacterium]
MKLSHDVRYLEVLLSRQLNSFSITSSRDLSDYLAPCLDEVLEKLNLCFSYNTNKYFQEEGGTYFNFYHSDQYAIFLYYLSNRVFGKFGNRELADKLYYLNKIMNAIDLYYEVEMPAIFALGHPVGTVLGRAKYSDFFSVSQNCTVGNNKGIYPRFEKFVTMFSGSKVIGNCEIGENVMISANTYIKDTNIKANSMVFGSSPNLTIKQIDRSFHDRVWRLRH